MTDAIEVTGLGKEYVLGGESMQYGSFRELLANLIFAPFRRFKMLARESDAPRFWALKNVSFKIKQGEVVGIIGKNGAGKSTLLKVLSRITAPTEGEVIYRGKVASLLEVGTGFHGELSGRENIFLNGSILGMSKFEVEHRLEDIIKFAGVEKFLDTPVKRYSSGMYVRLAFAVAAHMDPDILIVDEVLAVGDADFQKKCLNKLGDAAKTGRTILFVSHNMNSIRTLCNRVICVKDGEIVGDGDPNQVIGEYLKKFTLDESSWSADDDNEKEWKHLARVSIKSSSGEITNTVGYDETARVEITYMAPEEKDHIVALRITDLMGNVIFTSWESDFISDKTTSPGELTSSICNLSGQLLKPGEYVLTVFIWVQSHTVKLEREEIELALHITDQGATQDRGRLGIIAPRLTWESEIGIK